MVAAIIERRFVSRGEIVCNVIGRPRLVSTLGMRGSGRGLLETCVGSTVCHGRNYVRSRQWVNDTQPALACYI
jgi:hypothetical protein